MSNRKFTLPEVLLSEISNEDGVEVMRLLAEDDIEDLSEVEFSNTLPILPLRNMVLFPGVVIPITVSRKKSIKLIKKAYKEDKIIGVVAQKKEDTDDPQAEDLYATGTIAQILKMMVMPDGNTTIIIQGRMRFEIEEYLTTTPYLTAKINFLAVEKKDKNKKMAKAMMETLKETAFKILDLNPEIPQEARIAIDNIKSTNFLADFLSSNVNAEIAEKQKLLEIKDGEERAQKLLDYLNRDLQILELKSEIQSKVNTDLDQQQRDYFLRQQLKVLQDELGYDNGFTDAEELRMRASKKKWPEEVQTQFEKELLKLKRYNPASPEYPIAINYLELLLDLPWGEYTKDKLDFVRAQKVLDSQHFGMEKVKERILEYLAVYKLKKDLRGPIICLYGPPGVGKTSLGKSIAQALGRKYVRMSLGGMQDEAEIRGHRKTYIGSMPGKIIQNIKKSGSSNPVFILDEIDKINSNLRDPSSALLEVLDPEQNTAFMDNYLDVPYDLSKTLFIATANSLDTIQPALRDRMEIIEVTGYTLEEKVEIAKKHLIPKQRKEHGLNGTQIKFQNQSIVKLIERYTRESGVRDLERQIAALCRKTAKSIAMELEYSSNIKPQDILNALGVEKVDKDLYESEEVAGLVTGLAWTSVGGEILFIESSLSRGKGKVVLSGQLGDVMKESANTALSYLKAHAEDYDIPYQLFEKYDLHMHIPAGAIPKDGPSAGVTILTSIASIFTQRKVKDKMAMTGEITLRGKVLPVGGIKEKILAAKRVGVKEVILCNRNQKDIEEIPSRYLEGMKFHYIKEAKEVLELALLKRKVKNSKKLIIE